MASSDAVVHGGQTLHQLRLSGATLAEVSYAPGLHVPVHTHAHAHIGCVLAGTCKEVVGRRAYHYEPSELIVKSPGESHSNLAGMRGTHYMIVDLEESRALPEILEERTQVREESLRPIVHRMLHELRAPDELTSLSCDGLVLELLAAVGRARRRAASRYAPGWIEQARELLRDRAFESLSLRGAAFELGVHPTHFSRAFRRHVGMTPGAYVRSVRISRAVALLTQTDQPIHDVALACGFSDQSHLTRALRRETGTTPAEYRRRSQR